MAKKSTKPDRSDLTSDTNPKQVFKCPVCSNPLPEKTPYWNPMTDGCRSCNEPHECKYCEQIISRERCWPLPIEAENYVSCGECSSEYHLTCFSKYGMCMNHGCSLEEILIAPDKFVGKKDLPKRDRDKIMLEGVLKEYHTYKNKPHPIKDKGERAVHNFALIGASESLCKVMREYLHQYRNIQRHMRREVKDIVYNEWITAGWRIAIGMSAWIGVNAIGPQENEQMTSYFGSIATWISLGAFFSAFWTILTIINKEYKTKQFSTYATYTKQLVALNKEYKRKLHEVQHA